MVLAKEVLTTVKNGMWFQEGYQRNKRQVSSLHLQVGAHMLVPGMTGSPGLLGQQENPKPLAPRFYGRSLFSPTGPQRKRGQALGMLRPKEAG